MLFFFFNDTATTEIYTLSLHDALPICIGVELSTFGSKTKEELFFGDRTDVPETWDDWTYNKLHTPRTYATKWIEQLMPQFDLADEDLKALRAFLASRTDAEVPAE